MSTLITVLIVILGIGFLVFLLNLWQKVLNHNDKVLERRKKEREKKTEHK
ncbi:hypothetical protein ACU3L3_09915 [Priestia endophytica]|uniref:Uncharacterized protein n=1 Tax=Priestia endophytica DSM 13796 TaxID=1121089 RepID=A0A1I6BUC4_9BACI|nr:hypothetical protein [Priestia endophytica]SFQ84529.1 hypothetical protein SAMN02745910_04207 [Priestia endophytica DSM 13796]